MHNSIYLQNPIAVTRSLRSQLLIMALIICIHINYLSNTGGYNLVIEWITKKLLSVPLLETTQKKYQDISLNTLFNNYCDHSGRYPLR